MSALEDIDLSDAYRMYAISNTPIFLVKQLRADPATNEIARIFSGEQILAALQELAGKESRSGSDYVRPYAYLVALSKLPEIKFLNSAVDIDETGVWDWFSYIQQYLVDTYSPLIVDTIEPPRVSNYASIVETIGAAR